MHHGTIYHVPAAEWPPRIARMLETVGRSDRTNECARFFSRGMERRLEIARGLQHHPAVLIQDEPTLDFDSHTR